MNWNESVGDVSCTLDDLGRLTHDGTYTYIWDRAGRLITVTDGITTVGFRYDGDGNRLVQIVNGTFTTYTLAPFGGLRTGCGIGLAGSESRLRLF